MNILEKQLLFMKGFKMCEIFEQGKCILGCQALEDLKDIDIAKYSCEIYKEMKSNEGNGI